MQQDTLPFPVNLTLTSDNAESRGYQWEADVLRNDQGEIEGKELIEQKVKSEGYILGQPWANDKYKTPYGLYKPLKKTVQIQKRYDK